MDIPAMFASIAIGISDAFGGPFVDAQVITQTAIETDDGGSVIGGGDPILRDCKAQVDACTEDMRQADGYTDKDMRILILSATLDGAIDTDAEIRVLAGPHAGPWSIESIGSDPMSAYHELRGRPV